MKNSQYSAQVDIGREHGLFLANEVTIMKITWYCISVDLDLCRTLSMMII